MTSLIVMPPDELRQLLSEAVREALLQHGQAPEKEWMNVPEAAEHLRTTSNALYQLTSSRSIPFHKRGERVLFSRSELDGWIRGT